MDVTQLQPTREKYKLYTGSYAEQMPRLIADGGRPASVADIVRARNDTIYGLNYGLAVYADQLPTFLKIVDMIRSNQGFRRDEVLDAFFWWLNYFHTIDGFHSGRIVLSPGQLKNISPAAALKDGALPIDETIEGLLVDNSTKSGRFYLDRAKMDPSWGYVLRGDEQLQDSYSINTFHHSKLFDHSEAMGVHLPQTQDLVPIRIQSLQNGSGLYGKNPLNKANARLVGIRD